MGHRSGRLGKRHPEGAIGELLSQLMTQRSWGCRDLARESGVSHQYVAFVCRGHRIPRREMLDRLLLPFGLRAIYEIRVEPIERKTEDTEVANLDRQ
jgi:transcriptional regulator with XRE-family HTH domain